MTMQRKDNGADDGAAVMNVTVGNAPSNNGLRDQGGALIGGLVVEDYNAGIEDFYAGKPVPDLTSPSYDLGRQRAAEEQARHDWVKDWMARQDARSDAAMRELLSPAAYKEFREKIDAIRARCADAERTPGEKER
jgi:hypothetical protein